MSENQISTCQVTPQTTRRNTAAPAVDIVELQEFYQLEVDLPGVQRDSIAVEIEQSVLTISADRPRGVGEGAKLAAGSPVDGYYRRLRLGEDIDAESIEANYAHGILTVKLPKRAETQPRRIEVK
jgi:HSP20 family protein